MTWPSPRSSYTNLSIHQTLIGKAIYEHGDYPLVAAVASVSPIFRNSSLGPNLLALTSLKTRSDLDLFCKIFSPSNTLQFTKIIDFSPPCKYTEDAKHVACPELEYFCSFASQLLQTRYFSRSIKTLHIPCITPTMDALFKHLQGAPNVEYFTFSATNDEKMVLETAASFPKLRKFSICLDDVDAETWNLVGHLGNLTCLTELNLSYSPENLDLEAFRRHFCDRLLAKNRLVKLSGGIQRTEENEEWALWEPYLDAIASANPTNITEVENFPQACIGRGDGFTMIRKLEFHQVHASDDELVAIGNKCLLFEDLYIRCQGVTGSFLCDESLCEDAFKLLTSFHVDGSWSLIEDEFNDEDCGDGFSRLVSLTSLGVNACSGFDGSALQCLPRPSKLEYFDGSGEFLVTDELVDNFVLRCSNLKTLWLAVGTISCGTILSLRKLTYLEEVFITDNDPGIASGTLATLCHFWPNIKKISIEADEHVEHYRMKVCDLEEILETTSSTLEELTFGVWWSSKNNQAGERALLKKIMSKYPRVNVADTDGSKIALEEISAQKTSGEEGRRQREE